MNPFPMGEYWYARIGSRLIRCESYEAACEILQTGDCDN